MCNTYRNPSSIKRKRYAFIDRIDEGLSPRLPENNKQQSL